MGNTQGYVEWFRGAAPYIKAHREKTFVVMVSDEVIYSDRFIGLVHDIALLKHLGIKSIFSPPSHDLAVQPSTYPPIA